jgi:hypothetical protein
MDVFSYFGGFNLKGDLMKKWIASLCVAVVGLVGTGSALANDFKDLRAKMTAARESLITMATDKAKRGADQQKRVKDTADVVSAAIAELKAPAGKEAQFKDMVDTWAAFEKTRETELVPAILAGKDDEALKIAGGIQKERFAKCLSLVGELGG